MSLVTHVAVFFATNPDEELTASDIAAKFGVDPNNVGKTLRYAEEKGWVKVTRKPHHTSIKKTVRVYTPGSKLMQEIGRWRQHEHLRMRCYQKENGRRVKTMEMPWTLWLRARSNVMRGMPGYDRTEAARDRVAVIKGMLAAGDKPEYIAAVVGVTRQRVQQIKYRSKEAA